MNIEEAIEILTHLKAATNSASRQECEKAYQLGIEALKKWKGYRACDQVWWGNLLPGETEPEPQPTRDEVKRYMDERKGEPKE